MKYPLVEAGELMARRNGSVDPAKFPDEMFELHSIPAFDAGQPELLPGSKIGSSKQIVQPNDVMISKIVPHIRRSSIVGASSGTRQIASGEWIVFRDERISPSYLRHVLTSDQFNTRFMATVSGVGGSLLRARPAEVAKIQIPLPPLDEQQRLAAILDKADAIRAKRREVVAKLDQLLQSVFLEMFGDPSSNPFNWPVHELGDLLIDGPQNGLYKPAQEYGSGTPILRIDGWSAGDIITASPAKRVRLADIEINKYGLKAGDIIINRVNSPVHLGKPALIKEVLEPTVFESNMMRMSIDTTVASPTYLLKYLIQQFVKDQIATRRKDAINQSSINQGDVKSLQINVPPLALQEKFEKIQDLISRQYAEAVSSAQLLTGLFGSLQQRAFAGNL